MKRREHAANSIHPSELKIGYTYPGWAVHHLAPQGCIVEDARGGACVLDRGKRWVTVSGYSPDISPLEPFTVRWIPQQKPRYLKVKSGDVRHFMDLARVDPSQAVEFRVSGGRYMVFDGRIYSLCDALPIAVREIVKILWVSK